MALRKALAGEDLSRRDSQRLAGGGARSDPSGLAGTTGSPEKEVPAPAGASELSRCVSAAPTGADSHGGGDPVVLARSSLHHRLISGSPCGTHRPRVLSETGLILVPFPANCESREPLSSAQNEETHRGGAQMGAAALLPPLPCRLPRPCRLARSGSYRWGVVARGVVHGLGGLKMILP